MKKKKTRGNPSGFFVEIGGAGIMYKSTGQFFYAFLNAASNGRLE